MPNAAHPADCEVIVLKRPFSNKTTLIVLRYNPFRAALWCRF